MGHILKRHWQKPRICFALSEDEVQMAG